MATDSIRRRIGIRDLELRLDRERSTISRWIRLGLFPRAHYIGSRRCWYVDEIEAWETEHTRTTIDPLYVPPRVAP